MKSISSSWLGVGLLVVALSGFVPKKPRILLIGDSISIGYTPFVQARLAQQAEVFHNPGNAEHTGTGLKKIDTWLGEGDWDLIQFNWGLWDLCYRHPDSKIQGNRDKERGTLTYTVEAYAANLDSIVTLLRQQTDAKLIFVTTSYVPEAEAGRFQADAIRYNEAARQVMAKHAVAVRDLYGPSVRIHRRFGKGPDDVHYTEKGYEKLGKVVAGFLAAEIRSMPDP